MKTNEVLENIKARRSVRAYTEQQVPEEDLRTILEAATYAPSGMHLETWHFTAIQNVSKLAELNKRIKGAFAKSDDVRLQERARNKAYCCYYHAPTLVIVSNEPTQWWAGYGLRLCNREYVFGCTVFRYRLLLDQSVRYDL